LSDFECAEIIEVPILALLEPNAYRWEPEIVREGKAFLPHVYYYKDNEIIGATATILKQFLSIYAQVIKH
jgi:hypothetical protein